MTPIIKYCISIFAIALFISCSNTVYKSIWQSQPAQANHNPDEAPRPYKFFDGETGMYYTISNDLDNIYISIKTSSQQTQTRILRSGIQFCIDTTGKYGEQTKIVFPFALMQKKNQENDNYTPDKYGKPESLSLLKNKFMSENKQMHLIGFKSPIGGIVPIPNDYGIKMSITWDSTNTMIYEACIPFVTFYKKSLSFTDSAKVIGILMMLTSLPPSRYSNGDRPVGMGPQISMGMGGVGFGVRIPINRNDGLRSGGPYQQNTTIKMKVKLALRQEG